MMKFGRVRESIEALEVADTVTVLDALNIFYDLCEDIKDSENCAVDKLPTGDGEKVVSRLCWAGRTMLRIARKNTEAVEGLDKIERLEKVSGELEDQDQKLSQTEQRIGFLRAKQEQLCNMQAALEAALEKERGMAEECRRLEDDIRDYETLKSPKLESQLDELKHRKDDCQENYLHQKQQLERLQEDLAEKLSEGAQLADEMRLASDELTQVTEQNRKMTQRFIELNQQLQSMDEEHRSLVENIRTLEEHLSCKELESLKALYVQRQEEITRYQEDCHILDEQIKDGEKLLEALRQELNGKVKYHQEMAWKEENERMKAEGDLKDLRRRMEDARNQKRSLLEQLKQQEDEQKELEGWFSSLEVQNYKDRLTACNERTRLLKSARDGLLEELTTVLAFTTEPARSHLVDCQKYYRDTMDEIEKQLDKYQECYKIVMDIYENGGSLL